MWRKGTVIAALVALAISGCTSSTDKSTPGSSDTVAPSGGNAGGGGLSSGVAGKKVTFIIYAPPSTPFFNPVINGAKDAAAAYGIDLNIEYSDGNATTQNNQIQTALAAGVDGLALSIPTDDGFTKSVCAAKDKGVPVVAFNVTASKGPVLDCVLSFVGQNFVQAGKLLAQRMIDDGKIKSGDSVACPVEDPAAVYAIQRAEGANEALATIGVKCDVFPTGFDLAKAQTALQQYLLGRKETKAILGLGQVPLQVSPAAAKAAGVSAAIGGFDLSTDISKSIKAGDIVAAVNQQPYLQGFLSVQQLALKFKYGLTPDNYDTGNALVDKTNVDKMSQLAGSVY